MLSYFPNKSLVWITLAGSFFCQVVVAQAAPIDFIPYDEARILKQEERQVVSYKLALGPYLKRSNRWQAEESKRLQGQLRRQTHEFPAGFDENEVFTFYREQLPEDVTETLFTCSGRNCGESNNWANDHFRVKQLYGLDQYQYLGVYKVGDDQYVSLYTVRRGNRRVYAQIDAIVVD